MTEPVSRASERTLPELVGWVKQEGLALNLANDRLAFLIAIATLSREAGEQGFGRVEEAHQAFQGIGHGGCRTGRLGR